MPSGKSCYSGLNATTTTPSSQCQGSMARNTTSGGVQQAMLGPLQPERRWNAAARVIGISVRAVLVCLLLPAFYKAAVCTGLQVDAEAVMMMQHTASWLAKDMTRAGLTAKDLEVCSKEFFHHYDTRATTQERARAIRAFASSMLNHPAVTPATKSKIAPWINPFTEVLRRTVMFVWALFPGTTRWVERLARGDMRFICNLIDRDGWASGRLAGVGAPALREETGY